MDSEWDHHAAAEMEVELMASASGSSPSTACPRAHLMPKPSERTDKLLLHARAARRGLGALPTLRAPSRSLPLPWPASDAR